MTLWVLMSHSKLQNAAWTFSSLCRCWSRLWSMQVELVLFNRERYIYVWQQCYSFALTYNLSPLTLLCCSITECYKDSLKIWQIIKSLQKSGSQPTIAEIWGWAGRKLLFGVLTRARKHIHLTWAWSAQYKTTGSTKVNRTKRTMKPATII